MDGLELTPKLIIAAGKYGESDPVEVAVSALKQQLKVCWDIEERKVVVRLLVSTIFEQHACPALEDAKDGVVVFVISSFEGFKDGTGFL
jgi:hypothetical protein